MTVLARGPAPVQERLNVGENKQEYGGVALRLRTPRCVRRAFAP
jgi:hypothetical protein